MLALYTKELSILVIFVGVRYIITVTKLHHSDSHRVCVMSKDFALGIIAHIDENSQQSVGLTINSQTKPRETVKNAAKPLIRQIVFFRLLVIIHDLSFPMTLS